MKLSLAAYIAVTLLFFAGGETWAKDSPQKQEKLNGGYYLLYHLLEDEAQLPLLFDFKHSPPELDKFADRISQTAKQGNDLLEEMQDHHPAIKFDQNPLPPIEKDVRDSIRDNKQHELLFGTSNEEFVRAVLISQLEASNYAQHLAKVLAEQESDSRRVKALKKISSQWASIHDDLFHMLGRHSRE